MADAESLVVDRCNSLEGGCHRDAAEEEALNVTEGACGDTLEPGDVDRAVNVDVDLVVRPSSRPDIVEDRFAVNLLRFGLCEPREVDSERIGGQLAFLAVEHVEMRSGKLH